MPRAEGGEPKPKNPNIWFQGGCQAGEKLHDQGQVKDSVTVW